MERASMERRDVLRTLAGGAAFGSVLGLPRVVGHTAAGELLESDAEYGGFVVERPSGPRGGNEYDPEVLQPMGETQTVFSRNI